MRSEISRAISRATVVQPGLPEHRGSPDGTQQVLRLLAATSDRIRGRGALASDRLTAHLRGLGAAGLLLAVVGSVALIAPQAASADTTPRMQPRVVPSLQSHDVAGFPGDLSTTAPFNECPQIGCDASCGIVIVISNNGEQVLQDPNNAVSGVTNPSPGSQVPYDQGDDTLVGIVNESSKPVYGLQLSGESTGTDLFGFDGDGICTYATGGSNTNGGADGGGEVPLPGPGGYTGDSTATPRSWPGAPDRMAPTPTAATTRGRTTRSRTSARTRLRATSTSPTGCIPASPPTSPWRNPWSPTR